MEKQTIKLVLVDDHLLIAKAIRSILESFDEFSVLFECENGKVLMERLEKSSIKPDLILLDISMPEMDGFETTRLLQDTHPEILIMALTMQQDEESLTKMIRMGAAGYINKNVTPSDLRNAILQLYQRGFYYPDWASGKLLRKIVKGEPITESGIKISEREKEFLSFVGTELTYKEIGIEMNCSPRTVEGYRDSLFEKIGVKTRVGLAIYAVKNGYYDVG